MLRCMRLLRNYTEGQNCMPIRHPCASFSHTYILSFHVGLSAGVQGKKERATGPRASHHKPQLHLPSHRVSRTAAHAFSAFSLSAQFVFSRMPSFPTDRGGQSSWHKVWKPHTDHSAGQIRVQPLVRKEHIHANLCQQFSSVLFYYFHTVVFFVKIFNSFLNEHFHLHFIFTTVLFYSK